MIAAAGASAGAQRDATDVGRDVAVLEAKVDRLQASIDARSAGAAPQAAWVALGIVGAVFAVAWGIVSWRREKTRETEAILEAAAKGAALTDKTRIDDEFDKRIKRLIDAIDDAGKRGGGLAGAQMVVEWLSRWLGTKARRTS